MIVLIIKQSLFWGTIFSLWHLFNAVNNINKPNHDSQYNWKFLKKEKDNWILLLSQNFMSLKMPKLISHSPRRVKIFFYFYSNNHLTIYYILELGCNDIFSYDQIHQFSELSLNRL